MISAHTIRPRPLFAERTGGKQYCISVHASAARYLALRLTLA
jgi:hypothetical protein